MDDFINQLPAIIEGLKLGETTAYAALISGLLTIYQLPGMQQLLPPRLRWQDGHNKFVKQVGLISSAVVAVLGGQVVQQEALSPDALLQASTVSLLAFGFHKLVQLIQSLRHSRKLDVSDRTKAGERPEDILLKPPTPKL